MDAFESVVSTILRQQGYWTWLSFKVELTKDEKRAIDRPSNPRWELDILAYKASLNEILVAECKSYLDSPGVRASHFSPNGSTRYKLFNERNTRKVVFSRLVKQMLEAGLCQPSPQVRLGLVSGKIATSKDRDLLRKHFKSEGWLLWDDEWLREELHRMAQGGYENEVAAVVAKLLLRGNDAV